MTLSILLAGVVVALSVQAQEQQNLWDAPGPDFVFSTPDRQVSCLGHNWRRNAVHGGPFIWCRGVRRPGLSDLASGLCDDRGCRGRPWNSPWRADSPLPEGSRVGDDSTPFECEVSTSSVFCLRRGGGHFVVNAHGLIQARRGT